MSKLDVNSDIFISWESVPFTAPLMSEIKANTWFLIKSIWINYVSADDFVLFVKLLRKGTPTVKKFTVKKEYTYMSFRLPVGQICDEFTLGITNVENSGITSSLFEVKSLGALWKPIPLGIRG